MLAYRFVRNEKATQKNKKYQAILINERTQREIRVPYGDSRYEQFRDSTGLGVYSSKNHLDKARRIRYKKRHQTYIKSGFYSPGYFSMKFLW
jgi:hypothetical protein